MDSLPVSEQRVKIFSEDSWFYDSMILSTAEEVMYEESKWELKPECVTDPQERFSTVLPALCLGAKLGE